MRRSLAVRAGLVAAALFAAVPAAADGPKPGGTDAKYYFDAAQKAFAEGRFEDAARAFEEAARIKPHPAPLINAGDAWDKAGEYALAARSFERVLTLEQAMEQDRSDAIERLARLGPRIGSIELLGDKSARVRVDDEEFHGGERVHVLPGVHHVSLVDVEGARVRDLDIAAGTRRSVKVDSLRPAGAAASGPSEPGASPGSAAPGSAPDGGGRVRPLTLVAYGVGVVGLAGTVVFGLQVNSAEESYNQDPNRDDLDRFDRAKLFTNVSLGVGVLGIAAGTVLLLGDLGKPSVGVAPTAGGAVLVGRGRF